MTEDGKIETRDLMFIGAVFYKIRSKMGTASNLYFTDKDGNEWRRRVTDSWTYSLLACEVVGYQDVTVVGDFPTEDIDDLQLNFLERDVEKGTTCDNCSYFYDNVLPQSHIEAYFLTRKEADKHLAEMRENAKEARL